MIPDQQAQALPDPEIQLESPQAVASCSAVEEPDVKQEIADDYEDTQEAKKYPEF